MHFVNQFAGDEEDQPVIQGFSDDDCLVVALVIHVLALFSEATYFLEKLNLSFVVKTSTKFNLKESS